MSNQAHGSLPIDGNDYNQLLSAGQRQDAPIGPVDSERVSEVVAPQNGHGVWVCAEQIDSLVPALFIQALCPERFPLPACARPARPSRSADNRPAGVSLLHGFCSASSEGHDPLLLFAARLDTPDLLRHESDLTDWMFPVPISGIVVLLGRMGANDFIGRLASRIGLSRQDTLGWARTQELPLVLGAMGLDAHDVARHVSWKRYGLPSETRVVVGPPPTRRRLPKEGCHSEAKRFELASLLSAGDLRFDENYATRILCALCEEMRRVKKARV